MTNRMTTDEVLAALDGITPETMALAQASLRRTTCTAAPDTTDAARQAHRDTLHDLITRIGHGRAGADVATLLRVHLDAEIADGDQAREQLAEAHENLRRADRAADRAARRWDDDLTGRTAVLLIRAEAAEERAERAEATITAVSRLADSLDAEANANHVAGRGHMRDASRRIRAALGDPQPAPEPAPTCETGDIRTCTSACPVHGEMRCCVCGSPEVAYRNYREQPFCWPCADGTAQPAQDGKTPPAAEREQPAEPQLVSVIDALATDIVNAFRRALTTITKEH